MGIDDIILITSGAGSRPLPTGPSGRGPSAAAYTPAHCPPVRSFGRLGDVIISRRIHAINR